LTGVDSHKASVALAAVDEVGELIECASFPQNRAGLRALERWAKRFCERRWAVENAGGLGKHLSQRLAAVDPEAGAEVLRLLSARR
jgi:transposase